MVFRLELRDRLIELLLVIFLESFKLGIPLLLSLFPAGMLVKRNVLSILSIDRLRCPVLSPSDDGGVIRLVVFW